MTFSLGPPCPNCGAPVAWRFIRPRRPFPCPHCGTGLYTPPAHDNIPAAASVVLAVVASLGFGLRGLPALLATVAFFFPSAFVVALAHRLMPPRLRQAANVAAEVPNRRRGRQGRPFGFGTRSEDPPITLGLSAPPPSAHVPPGGQEDSDARGTGTDRT